MVLLQERHVRRDRGLVGAANVARVRLHPEPGAALDAQRCTRRVKGGGK